MNNSSPPTFSTLQRYTANLTYDELCTDDKTLDAVIHNLLIIGEATQQIPNSLRLKYSQTAENLDR
ncbi:hypothetical protein MC7420_3166 [Coleofasciculus chthonoplastes PCC 7420]|uniref:Uncharacterized protein n=1 Tax=Coleofasciculus chthonoplastes PCC 7420 TaxID=118168 RepID=B4VK62_9CYAN|nr:HepT-like ribonuclease domain-containing protein [Coleofasciculus chthonoplastes]EDX77842.1 hypothetical protein MC7420_3166 [Coleofasciculus chthonoplastes PCC 7420]